MLKELFFSKEKRFNLLFRGKLKNQIKSCIQKRNLFDLLVSIFLGLLKYRLFLLLRADKGEMIYCYDLTE